MLSGVVTLRLAVQLNSRTGRVQRTVPVRSKVGHSGVAVVRFARCMQFVSTILIAPVFVVAAQMNLSQPAAVMAPGTECTNDVSLLTSQVALIMNGTFEPRVTPEWIGHVISEVVTPTLGAGYLGAAMDTPEEFWPASGLFSLSFDNSIETGFALLDAQIRQNLQESPHTPLAVFGLSQSAVIASVEKRTLATQYVDGVNVPPVSIVMTGNPYRPNGGILSRLPILARILTPWTEMTATQTDTMFTTHDIAHQYDLWADFPAYPLNLLADINAIFGLMNHWYLPQSSVRLIDKLLPTISLDPASPDYNPDMVISTYGDTTYYTIPSEHLPMLMPLRWIGLGPLTDIVEPALRVLVELGYDRTASPGQVVRAGVLPKINPGKLAADFGAALAEGAVALRNLLRFPERATAAGSIRSTARRGDVIATRARSAASRNPNPNVMRRTTVNAASAHGHPTKAA